MEAFVNHAMTVYSRGGTAIVPCTMDGIVFDLLENWDLFLRSRQHAPIPIYIISSVAAALWEVHIGPQWLCDAKVAKVKYLFFE